MEKSLKHALYRALLWYGVCKVIKFIKSVPALAGQSFIKNYFIWSFIENFKLKIKVVIH